MPDDVEYDAARGYWTRDGVPLVRMQGARPATKKADIETGEDMKGE